MDELIKLVDEPERVVVPKFVAEWYKKSKDELEFDIFNLVATIGEKDYDELTEIEAWFNNIGNEPIETIMKMKLFGYKVEKEKLYHVYLHDGNCLVSDDNKDFTKASTYFMHEESSGFLNRHLFFTEEQIKQIDENYWPFAVEVEE